MPANPDYCPHGATVMWSRTLSIDECKQCGAFLVWCVNPAHESVRHWHRVDDRDSARRLAFGAPKTGIHRPPLTDQYQGADHE